MTMTIVAGCVLVVALVVDLLSRPATSRRRERDAARRAAFVASDPSQALTADVVAALHRAGRSDAEVEAFLQRAAELGHTPATAWAWLSTHGADGDLLGGAVTTPGPDLAGPESGSWGRVSLSDNVRREKAVRRAGSHAA